LALGPQRKLLVERRPREIVQASAEDRRVPRLHRLPGRRAPRGGQPTRQQRVVRLPNQHQVSPVAPYDHPFTLRTTSPPPVPLDRSAAQQPEAGKVIRAGNSASCPETLPLHDRSTTWLVSWRIARIRIRAPALRAS